MVPELRWLIAVCGRVDEVRNWLTAAAGRAHILTTLLAYHFAVSITLHPSIIGKNKL